MRCKSVLLAGMLACIPSLVFAQQRSSPGAEAVVQWRKHTFADDRFEIEFSGPVRSQPVPLDAQTRRRVVRSTQHLQEDAKAIYIVAAQLNAQAVNFDAGIKGSFNTLRCKSTAPGVDVPIPGGRGRELKGGDCHDGTMRADARYFETGKWFYQVMAIYPKDGDEATARRFLQSFKLLER